MGNYSKYAGKKVKLVRAEAGKTDAVEIEGTVESANELGLVLKPKGKTQFELIPASEIEEISFVEDKLKPLARKTLKVVEFGQARNHLLERHGFTLAQINALTEQEAFDAHEAIDHETADLGHAHGDKAAERVEVVAAAAE